MRLICFEAASYLATKSPLVLVVGEKVEERGVNLDRAVVVDESLFAETVHEVADAGPGGADHLRQSLLADFNAHGFGVGLAAKASHGQEDAGQALFAGAEDLIDELFYDTTDAAEEMRDEKLRKSGLLVDDVDEARAGDAGDGAGLNRSCGGHAPGSIDQASLSEEVPFTVDADNGFFPVLGLDRQLHVPAANVEQGVGAVVLGEDFLPVRIIACGRLSIDPLEEIKRSNRTPRCRCHDDSHAT